MPFTVTVILFATIVVNSLMILMLSSVGGDFRRSIKVFVTSAVSANLWALGALLLLISPIEAFGGVGRLLFLVAPMWVMYWLFLFAENYPGGEVFSRQTHRLVLMMVLLSSVSVSVSTVHLVPSSELAISGLYNPSVAVLPYGGYAIFFSLFSWLYSSSFRRKLRHESRARQHQAWFAYGGVLVSSFVAFLTNLVLPLLGIAEYIWVGPASSFIYALSYAFAMKRYRLFDVRRFAVRAVVYFVALTVLVFIYASVMGIIRSVLEQVLRTPVSSDLFYTVMTVVAVFLYEPLKRLFDRYTQRIFFKNEYEIQDVIDTLGGILLRASSRHEIVVQATRLLRTTLLTDKITVIMSDSSKREVSELENVFHTVRSSVVLVDDERTPHEISTWMRSHEYEIVSNVKVQEHNIGWIALGPKRSGDAYASRDTALVAIASDEMAIALESALQYEQIQAFNQTLQAKIKDATAELRDSNKKLRSIDAGKDEFISMASHQLRTPLTSIKGYISMLLEGDLGEMTLRQRKALEEAYNSSQRMVYLIGDFLNLSRIQTGRFELELSEVSLPHIIDEEIAQLQASAKSRGVALSYESPQDLPLLRVDENKIRQVMMNFIDNAIYYAKPDGGKVTVSLIAHSDHISFRVKDNGIGVPSDERHHLFTKFYRAHNARKVRPDGTGIGLYMAKKVIIAHGGSIIFNSREGEGSEFGFRLPR